MSTNLTVPPRVRTRRVIVPMLLCLCSLRLAAQDAGTQHPAESSLRTGPEIDAYERLYFGLFPDITNFERATVRTLPDGAMEFVIARTGVSDTTLRISERLADSLQVELARHESYTLDDLRHPLVRAGIILPHDGRDPNDDAMVVRLADTSAGAFRLLCILDDSLTVVAPRSDTADTIALSRVIPIRTITTATIHTRWSVWKGLVMGWLTGTALGMKLFADMELNTNSGNRQMLADNGGSTAGFLTAAGASQIVGLPVACIGAAMATILPSRSNVRGMENERLRGRVLADHPGTSFPPEPLVRGILPEDVLRRASHMARDAFDDAIRLRHVLSRTGTEGLHLGLDYSMQFFNSGASAMWVPVGAHAHCALALLRFGSGGALLLRGAAGIGASTFGSGQGRSERLGISRDVYEDVSLVVSAHPSAWFHVGATHEKIACELGSYGWFYWSTLDQTSLAERLFAGLGAGFLTGRYTALEFSLRLSLRPIVHTYAVDNPSNPKTAPGPQHLVILRTTFSVALWRW